MTKKDRALEEARKIAQLAVGSPSDPMPEHYGVATSIVGRFQEDISGTLGVLLTQAEVALADSPALGAYKDQIRREISLMRNRMQDAVYYELGVQKDFYAPGNVYLSGTPS